MRGLNKVQLIGHLGRDPEVRRIQSGAGVATFTLAVDRQRRTPDGARASEAEWFRVVAWEGLADVCGEYLRQGSRVYVEGRLQSRGYADAEGVARMVVEVVANDLLLLDARPTTSAGATTESDHVEEPLPA
jgi:single-strand DNA-binding protein